MSKSIHKQWSVYFIEHEPTGATYVGVSPDPMKRLRQHNGEISGGAKYTTSKNKIGRWKHICLVHGFREPRQALQFEWAVKHVTPLKSKGIISRLEKLATVLKKEKWTSNAPFAYQVPLLLEFVYDFSSLSCFSTLPNYIDISIIH